MPRGDRTGPFGMGPLTGRAMGFCAGYGAPGYANVGCDPTAMPWCGHGRGRGWRHRYFATGLPHWARPGNWPGWGEGPGGDWPTPEQEASFLQARAKHLRKALEEIEKRLADLQGAGRAEA